MFDPDKHMNILGNKIEMTEASEPSDIVYEHQGTPYYKMWFRGIGAAILILFLLFLSFMLIFWLE
jgi:hypothetical protein